MKELGIQAKNSRSCQLVKIRIMKRRRRREGNDDREHKENYNIEKEKN